LDDIRKSDDYVVSFSPAIQAETTEVWRDLQAGMLHKDSRVNRENMRAAKIVTELFLLYSLVPSLVDERFTVAHQKLWEKEYMEHYKRCIQYEFIGIPARLVSQFFLERMIDGESQRHGDNWNVPFENVILARDYVASLTDTQATQAYLDILKGI